MINQAKNTFALIGVVTLIVIACSSALSDDDDVIIPNNSTEVNNSNTSGTTTTNTGTTNTSSSGTTTTNTVVQNQVGRYQISSAGGDSRAWVIDTANGKYIRLVIDGNGEPTGTPGVWFVWHDLPPQ